MSDDTIQKPQSSSTSSIKQCKNYNDHEHAVSSLTITPIRPASKVNISNEKDKLPDNDVSFSHQSVLIQPAGFASKPTPLASPCKSESTAMTQAPYSSSATIATESKKMALINAFTSQSSWLTSISALQRISIDASNSKSTGPSPPVKNSTTVCNLIKIHNSDEIKSEEESTSRIEQNISIQNFEHSNATNDCSKYLQKQNQPQLRQQPVPPHTQKKNCTPLRRGKWSPEEETYALAVIRAFNSGYLDAAPGTTLRTYLSEKLQCDPMRITKKFTGDASIGKRVFHPAVTGGKEIMKEIENSQVCYHFRHFHYLLNLIFFSTSCAYRSILTFEFLFDSLRFTLNSNNELSMTRQISKRSTKNGKKD